MKLFENEKVRVIALEPGACRYNYAVTSFGRIIRFSENMENDGVLLKGTNINGYPAFKIKPNGKDQTFYIHKLVAESFRDQDSADQIFVVHLDFNKKNNNVENLRWANRQEMSQHHRNNPFVKAGQEKRKNRVIHKGHKLTSTEVLRLKKKIFDPNRKTRLKMLAKQFGISEMQLYRIKSGENWSHVKMEEEMVQPK